MNTFRLGNESFGLRGITTIAGVWKEIIRFSLSITRIFRTGVEG